MHYRVGWLVERLTYLESIQLLRQGLDVRPLSGERPARRRKEVAPGGEPAPLDADADTSPTTVDGG